MRRCPKCNVNVGSPFVYCPVCQNELHEIEGDNEEYQLFPKPTAIKARSLFYKIQLFVMLTLCIVLLAIDYMFEVHESLHWSLIPVMWLIGAEIIIGPLIRKHTFHSNLFTNVAILAALLMYLTSKYLGDTAFCLKIEIPILVLITLVLNFVLSLIDKMGNALVYALCNVLVGIIPNIVMYLMYQHAPVLWSVCLLVSVVFLIGLIIFKGGQVFSEVEKRLNI